MSIGERLVKARHLRKMTQQEVATAIGVTLITYQRYETDKHTIKSDVLIKLCAVLECSPGWVLGTKEDGMVLEPESEVLKNLKKKFQEMNEEGQRKVLDYASDLESTGKYQYATIDLEKQEE